MEMMIAMRILLSKIYMAQVNVLRSLSASVTIRKRLDSRLRNLKRKHTHTHTHTQGLEGKGKLTNTKMTQYKIIL